jgi:nucleotide-binding universal stress UspA family protein
VQAFLVFIVWSQWNPTAYFREGMKGYLTAERSLFMNFKDILVHMDISQQCAARLDLAVNLAVRHKAHLTGLYVVTHPPYASESEALVQKAAELMEMFNQKTAGAGISAEWLPVDWNVAGIDMVQILNYYTHQKDLIIIGQTDESAKEGDTPSDLPERVILGSGRPVLVVPYAGTFDTVGERIIVAWKPGRASARAVNDAMPLLRNAKEVRVLSIKTPDELETAAKRPDCEICRHLERYNINVMEENLVTADIPVANILMNYAWENGCDLIVMGAYAHIARGTVTLGPVARQLFDHMTLPVLMSE